MSTIDTSKVLLIPNEVVIEDLKENTSSFVFSPLENGFGKTLGNSFRRVLLSKIKGYAINWISIPGVKHEFSTIDGILEDVSQIILNLKNLYFKKKVDCPEHEEINISIKKNVFTGGDINMFSKNFEVVNSSFEICHFSKDFNFEITINVEAGYGFEIAANFNKDEDEIGKIYIDSIYSPVRNVAFYEDNARVGNKLNYDSLKIVVETNGVLTPKEAIKEASMTLINHFVVFANDDNFVSKDKDAAANKILDVQLMMMKKLLGMPIASFGNRFGMRALNCFSNAGIHRLKDLVKLSKEEVMKIPNLGDKTYNETLSFLQTQGLSLGMDISKFEV